MLCADRVAISAFFAIHVGDNEAGRTEVPLIYLSDDNAFSRLCYLEATESITFIQEKEIIIMKPREEANKKKLKEIINGLSLV